MGLPTVGLTMGDPRGIGPEVTAAAWRAHRHRARFVVYAPESLFPNIDARFEAPEGATPERDAIERAAEDLRRGAIDAVVTAPVTKAAFGGEFPGHTELFAARLGVRDFAMMLTGARLTVVPATTHVAVRDVSGLLRTDEIARIARLVHRSLAGPWGIASPKIAIAALNPHAGDGGLFGDEEARVLLPAVEALRSEGIDASGPWSPDTVYHRAARGDFDCVLAPYHDQCLVPFKLLHFSDGVNVTLGLPRPRTSPDHGPAFDLAGKGIADPSSMIAALDLALRLSASIAG